MFPAAHGRAIGFPEGGADDRSLQGGFPVQSFTDHHALPKIFLAQVEPVGRHDCQQTMYYPALEMDRGGTCLPVPFRDKNPVHRFFFVFESGGAHFFYSGRNNCITTRFFSSRSISFSIVIPGNSESLWGR